MHTYTCMYVCMYIYMYVCKRDKSEVLCPITVWNNLEKIINIFSCIHRHIHVHTHIHTQMHTHMHVHMHMHSYYLKCMYICTRISHPDPELLFLRWSRTGRGRPDPELVFLRRSRLGPGGSDPELLFLRRSRPSPSRPDPELVFLKRSRPCPGPDSELLAPTQSYYSWNLAGQAAQALTQSYGSRLKVIIFEI